VIGTAAFRDHGSALCLFAAIALAPERSANHRFLALRLPLGRSMEKDPSRDSDPSEMTDFEKNATFEELERVAPDPDPNRVRQEKGNKGPEEVTRFGAVRRRPPRQMPR
jgi:hypothetical protein